MALKDIYIYMTTIGNVCYGIKWHFTKEIKIITFVLKAGHGVTESSSDCPQPPNKPVAESVLEANSVASQLASVFLTSPHNIRTDQFTSPENTPMTFLE